MGKLFIKGTVNQWFNGCFEIPVVGHGLFHGDDYEVMLRGDPVVGAGGAAPAVFADGGVGVPAFVLGGADAEAEAESGAVALFFTEGDAGDVEGELVGAHEGDGVFPEVAGAIEGAAICDHLEEACVVGDGGDEPAATAFEGWVFEGGEIGEGVAFEGAVVRGVGDGEPWGVFGFDVEGGVLHAEGGEEAFLNEVLEGLFGGAGDDGGEDIGAESVDPAFTGLVEEGEGAEGFDGLGEGGVGVADSGIAVDFAEVAGPGVGVSGGVAEEVADGGVASGGFGFVLAEEDGLVFESGEVESDGVIEGEFSFFAEDEGGGGGDALGHGVDAEEGVFFDGEFFIDVPVSEFLLIDGFSPVEDEDGAAGEFLFGDEGFDGGADGVELIGVEGGAGLAGVGGKGEGKYEDPAHPY